METDEQISKQHATHNQQINTDGGTAVTGNVDIKGGDFIGRDKIIKENRILGDIVMGGEITVGNITNSRGVAIGHGAIATVHIHEVAKADKMRVSLDLDQVRRIRLYVLDSIPFDNGFSLPKAGLNFHEEHETATWTKATFEGFLSAALFYLKCSLNASDKQWEGNDHALLNSTLMGQHIERVWGTGHQDENLIVKNVETIDEIVDLWSQTNLYPIGQLSEIMHCYCPAREPNSFYHGWRELCIWLTVNGLAGKRNDYITATAKFHLQGLWDVRSAHE